MIPYWMFYVTLAVAWIAVLGLLWQKRELKKMSSPSYASRKYTKQLNKDVDKILKQK